MSRSKLTWLMWTSRDKGLFPFKTPRSSLYFTPPVIGGSYDRLPESRRTRPESHPPSEPGTPPLVRSRKSRSEVFAHLLSHSLSRHDTGNRSPSFGQTPLPVSWSYVPSSTLPVPVSATAGRTGPFRPSEKPDWTVGPEPPLLRDDTPETSGTDPVQGVTPVDDDVCVTDNSSSQVRRTLCKPLKDGTFCSLEIITGKGDLFRDPCLYCSATGTEGPRGS